jgi:methylmalonyl-CoA mutase
MNPFPPVSKSDWLAKVEADLKGTSPDRLRSTTPGGLDIEPLYTAEDPHAQGAAGFPGVFPYVRGSAPVGGWLIRQEYDDPRPSVCKAQIELDLGRGVEAVWLRVGPRHGCRVLTTKELDDLLGSVDLTATSTYIEGGSDALAVAAGFLAVAASRGVSPEALRGGFAFDPIGLLAGEGRIQGGLRARLAELCDLAAWCASNAPGLRAVDVSSDPYDRGGASAVQEVAYSIATGIEYLRQLTHAGLSIQQAAGQIGFSYAVSGDFFTQIAKLRAARGLWAKVIVAVGGEQGAGAMPIHCRTSRFTMTKRDPWVNMLRVTAECTAAVLGGAQSVATLPFDAVIGPPNELAQRVARNTQIVLRDESHLDAVADPAGGSWFVETLTDQLARAAWAEVRAIEAAGGIVRALGSGRVVDAIDEVAKLRQQALAKRKAPIVGVSEFPNAAEEPVHREPIPQDEVKRMLRAGLDQLDVGAHREVLLGLARQVNDPERAPGSLTAACVAATTSGTDIYSVAAVLQHGQPDFHVEPIAQWRAAELWERLRDRSDRSEPRPTAFIANLGSIPSHKARSTWAQNLLAAAGVQSSTSEAFSDPGAIEAAWKDSPASLGVICGSDDDYETMLVPAVAALKRAGCPVVLVAGRPGERAAALREAGVSDFVFVGADVLRIMTDVLDSVGVDR